VGVRRRRLARAIGAAVAAQHADRPHAGADPRRGRPLYDRHSGDRDRSDATRNPDHLAPRGTRGRGLGDRTGAAGHALQYRGWHHAALAAAIPCWRPDRGRHAERCGRGDRTVRMSSCAPSTGSTWCCPTRRSGTSRSRTTRGTTGGWSASMSACPRPPISIGCGKHWSRPRPTPAARSASRRHGFSSTTVNGGSVVLTLTVWATPQGTGDVERTIVEASKQALDALGDGFRPTQITRTVPPDSDPSRFLKGRAAPGPVSLAVREEPRSRPKPACCSRARGRSERKPRGGEESFVGNLCQVGALRSRRSMGAIFDRRRRWVADFCSGFSGCRFPSLF